MLRGLKTSDIFKMSKILKKMNLKIEPSYKEINAEGKTITKEKTQQQVGAELFLSAFENLHMAEAEVNGLLADMSNMTTEEFSELPLEKTLEI